MYPVMNILYELAKYNSYLDELSCSLHRQWNLAPFMHAITGEASGELVLRICLPYFRLEIVVLSCQFFFKSVIGM